MENKLEPSLLDKVAIVTGASRGLGYEIAKKFIIAGANVMMCSQTKSSLKEAFSSLEKITRRNQKISFCAVDISNPQSVETLIQNTLSEFGGCHILVNNAGIYGPMGLSESVDLDSWKHAFEVNFFGSVLTIRAALPHFKQQKYGKIIQLSGGGATNPLPGISAYAASKAAIIRFIETVAGETTGSGIDINAIAPGALNTQMLDEVLKAGPNKVGKRFFDQSMEQKKSGGTSLMLGADLALFLASNMSDGISGKLISAKWDNWKDFPGHISDISNSDVLTLRRIVGRDRNMDFIDK